MGTVGRKDPILAALSRSLTPTKSLIRRKTKSNNLLGNKSRRNSNKIQRLHEGLHKLEEEGQQELELLQQDQRQDGLGHLQQEDRQLEEVVQQQGELELLQEEALPGETEHNYLYREPNYEIKLFT